MIFRCVVCKLHRKILCKKSCRSCYFKAYRKRLKKFIRYGMKGYPL